MQRKLSIIKNGYDVLRIIEMGLGEFKITNETGNNDFKVYTLSLFSKPQKLDFNKSKKWEISYHVSTNEMPTKIHLKNEDGKEYITLPLKELIDPDINTEIPIPLFKVLIPDSCLSKRYKRSIKGDKNHVVIDIGDNNSLEIFVTSADFVERNYIEKWQNVIFSLIANDMRFYATNSPEYMALNMYFGLNDCNHSSKLINQSVKITENIGVFVNTVNIPNLHEDKLDFLFLENSIYLTLLVNQTFSYSMTSKKYILYEKDMENTKFFNSTEILKWKRIFYEDRVRTDKIMNNYKEKIRRQESRYQTKRKRIN